MCQFTARDQRRRPLLLWLCRLRIWLRRLRQRQQQHQQQQQPSQQQQQHEAAPSPIEKRPILRRLALLRGRGGLLASASPSAAQGGNDHDAQGQATAAAAATCAQERRCCAEETGETEFKAKKIEKSVHYIFQIYGSKRCKRNYFGQEKHSQHQHLTDAISQLILFPIFEYFRASCPLATWPAAASCARIP